MIRGDTERLLREICELEFRSRKNVTGFLPGNYATTYTGSGLSFREARKYLAGDPVRHIDWNMTARLGEPFVRTFHEEREREIFLAIDVSPSMYTGYQTRNKIETAIEVAATLALSAVKQRDRLGYLLFSDSVHRIHPPRPGKAQLHRLLSDLVQYSTVTEPSGSTDPRVAIHAIEALRGRRFVIFLISDFIDHDVPDDLRFVRRRHDVSLLHIYDPIEFGDTMKADPDLLLPVFAPEGGRRAMMKPSLMKEHTLAATRSVLEQAATKYRILVHSISTSDAVGPALGAFLHRKRSLV